MIKEGYYIIDTTRKKPLVELVLDAADAYERVRPGQQAVIAEVAETVDLTELEDIGLKIITNKRLKPHHVIAGV